MSKSFLVIIFLAGIGAFGAVGANISRSSDPRQAPTPLPPDTGTSSAASSGGSTSTLVAPSVSVPVALAPGMAAPVRLIIPSLSLDDAVVPVGLTDEGAMDVPAGITGSVGWYESGTVPGTVGSAVMDAHVFAAFSELHDIKIGNSIYVRVADGTELRFIVSDIETYAIADVPVDALFNRADKERLNLITCAGKLTPNRSTYDHRLVVYATLAQE